MGRSAARLWSGEHTERRRKLRRIAVGSGTLAPQIALVRRVVVVRLVATERVRLL
jgi:hypothetical protein